MMIHRDFRVVLLGQVANICETNDALRVHRLSRTNNNLWKMANSQKKKKKRLISLSCKIIPRIRLLIAD